MEVVCGTLSLRSPRYIKNNVLRKHNSPIITYFESLCLLPHFFYYFLHLYLIIINFLFDDIHFHEIYDLFYL